MPFSLARVALAAALAIGAAACGARHHAPTITGRELYAQVPALRDAGRVTVGRVEIRTDQVLITGRNGQVFSVAQVIDGCRGGDPAADVDCTLALLVDQRFSVADHAPAPDTPAPAARADRSASIITSVVASVAVIGLSVGAVGGLVYGVATCKFPGCKAVFGVPLVLVGGGMLFLLGRD